MNKSNPPERVSRNAIVFSAKARCWLGLAIAGFILAIGAYSVWFQLYHGQQLSQNSADWGAFGDFLAGVLGPLFSFLAFLALLFSLRLQSEELELTRKELRRSREEAEESNKLRRAELRMGALSASPRLDGAYALETQPDVEFDRFVLPLDDRPLFEAELLCLQDGEVRTVGSTYVSSQTGNLVLNPSGDDWDNAGAGDSFWLVGLNRTGQPIYLKAELAADLDGDLFICFRTRPKLQPEVPPGLRDYSIGGEAANEFGNAVSEI